MVDLTTTYMGLELRNPIVVGSGNLTKSAESIVQCAASGAGAVVMKSLFEIPGEPDDSGETAPVEKLLRAEQYLDTIRQAKTGVCHAEPVVSQLSPMHEVAPGSMYVLMKGLLRRGIARRLVG